MRFLNLIQRIQALTPDAAADRFMEEAIRTYATKVKDTRKDQPKFNLEWRNLAILTLKEMDDDATATA